MMRSSILAAVLASIAASPVSASVIYVHAAATGAGSGSSWSDAFTALQPAIAAAQPGDEVWVAAGTYTPVDSVSSIVLRSGVAVYGGFAGNETSRAQRDWVSHPAILSGDVARDDTINPSPLVAWPSNIILNTPNAGHVVVADGVDSTAVLDGFQITRGAYGPAGLPAGDPLLIGSGLYCVGGSPTITNCAFTDNFAAFGHGGAVFLANSQASITHCTFYHNYVSQGSGGAIYIGGIGSPTITDCAFSSNVVVGYPGQTGQGGAIQLDMSRPVTIARCTFDGNIARAFGGGSFEIPRGGAISSFALGNSTVIRECTFRDNQATLGGGIFVWNPTTVINCVFSNNLALVEGAGLAAQWTTLTIISSTITSNVGAESGGVLAIESPPNFPAQTNIRNSVIWGNTVVGQGVSPRNVQLRGPFTARHSCVQDLFTVDPGEDPVNPANYPGCIVSNPLLANASNADFRLAPGSPCIDSGSNAHLPVGTAVDADNHTRVFRGLPGPGTAIVDMGAFEFASVAACTPSVTIASPTPELCPASSSQLTVAVAGSGPFAYQWRRNGVSLAAATGPSFLASAEGSYDCLVTNACGTVASPATTITVGLGFEIYAQPQSTTTCSGDIVGFQVLVGGWRPVTYQWRKDGQPITGATESILIIASATSADIGSYDCVISSVCGSIISDTAAMTSDGCCPADFNGVGGVTVQDIFDFLGAYFANSMQADFNGVGGVTVQDIFDYLAAFFSSGSC